MLLGWVWRIPFLASILLILVALFIRMRLRESPTFIVLEKHEQIAEHPLREIFGHSLPSVLRGIGLRMAENGGSYLFNSLAVAYATGTVMVEPVDRPDRRGGRLPDRDDLGAVGRPHLRPGRPGPGLPLRRGRACWCSPSPAGT